MVMVINHIDITNMARNPTNLMVESTDFTTLIMNLVLSLSTVYTLHAILVMIMMMTVKVKHMHLLVSPSHPNQVSLQKTEWKG